MEYRAFLSYSHKDRKWAEWLHRRLENYKFDRSLQGRETPFGRVPSTLRPIFRDREDFSGGEGLAEATRRALEASECLVVVCSPSAASSRYVNEEIRIFKAIGRGLRIVPIIVDGVPGDASKECFPAQLRHPASADAVLSGAPIEIIAADVREEGDGRELALHKVVAGLLGLGLDEIRKRAVRAQRRRIAVLTAISIVMGVLALGASVGAWVARQRTILAEERLDWALEVAGGVTSKVTTFKKKFGVPVPVLAELLREVEQLLDRLSKDAGQSPDLAMREAKMLDALSDSNHDLGNTTKALEQSQQAATKLEFLVSKAGSTLAMKNDLAWQYLKVGDLLRQRKELSNAKAKFLQAKVIFAELVKAEPNNLAWQDSETSVLGRLVDVLGLQGDQNAARATADDDIEMRRKLRGVSPQNTAYQLDLALALNRRGNLSLFGDNGSEAHQLFLESLGIMKTIAHLDPTNSDVSSTLARTEYSVGLASERLGNMGEAEKLYNDAYDLEKRISKDDPLNVSKLNVLAQTMNSLSFLYQRTDRLANAIALFQQQLEIRKNIIALDPEDGNQKSMVTIALTQLADAQRLSGDLGSAIASIEEAIRTGRELDASGASSAMDQSIRIIHLGMLASLMDSRGDQVRSLSAAEEMAALSEKLLTHDPGNGVALRGVVISKSMLAFKYRQRNELAQSLDALNNVLKQVEPDLPRLTRDVGWLQITSELYKQIYLTQWDLENFQAALDAATHCLDYAKRWSEQDPINRDARQALAVGYTVFANASRRLYKLEAAKAAHMSAIAIRSDLVKTDSYNLAYKADFANSWTRLGDVYSDLHEYSSALDAENHSIEISKELIAHDPSNTYWQAAIALSYSHVGYYLTKLERREDARGAYESSLSAHEKLSEADPTNQTWADDLKRARENVADFTNVNPPLEPAVASPRPIETNRPH